MVSVELNKIMKKFSNTVVLDNLNLFAKDKEFFILLGASGSGKSTTLNIISGLEKASSGDILFDGNNVNALGPLQRGVAMVFQDYALYPHMTVFNNMAFPLKMRHFSKESTIKKVNEVADLLGLNELLSRYPRELSGGQAQRVALGRALVRDPSIFLLDEPLSNLDAKIRSQIRIELKLIQKNLGKTFIYVTHDQQEAMSLGDHIAILHNGKLEQTGSPMEIYKKPINEYVAAFLGEPAINFFDLEKKDSKYYNEDLVISNNSNELKEITVGIRPESFTMNKHRDDDIAIKITPKAIEALGAYTLIVANTNSGKEIRVRMDTPKTIELTKQIVIYVPFSEIYIFDNNGSRIDNL